MYEGLERARDWLREKRMKIGVLYQHTPDAERISRQVLRKFARDKAKEESSKLKRDLRLGKKRKSTASATEKKEI